MHFMRQQLLKQLARHIDIQPRKYSQKEIVVVSFLFFFSSFN